MVKRVVQKLLFRHWLAFPEVRGATGNGFSSRRLQAVYDWSIRK